MHDALMQWAILKFLNKKVIFYKYNSYSIKVDLMNVMPHNEIMNEIKNLIKTLIFHLCIVCRTRNCFSLPDCETF